MTLIHDTSSMPAIKVQDAVVRLPMGPVFLVDLGYRVDEMNLGGRCVAQE